MKVVVVSGYFDPLHVGHLENIHMARELGDKLVVIVNNDKQAALKKGASFMHEADRVKIIEALGAVDEVFLSIDEDASVCKSLAVIRPHIFAKGGDRNCGEIPEGPVCEEHGIEIVDGLGQKIRASSQLIRDAKEKGLV